MTTFFAFVGYWFLACVLVLFVASPGARALARFLLAVLWNKLRGQSWDS